MGGVTVHTLEKTRAKTLFWVAVHACASLLLLTLWCVTTLLLAHASSLEAKYGFAPHAAPLRSFRSVYALVTTQFALWTLALTCTAVWFAHHPPPAASAGQRALMRATRWLLCGFSLALAVAQVLAWIKSTHYTSALDASRTAVGTAFNDLFCETRALQVCTQEDELEKLLLVIGGDQARATNTTVTVDSAKAATLAIWLRCRDLLVQSHGRMSPQELQLLADVAPTEATDAWCGASYLSEVNSGTESASTGTAARSPFDAAPAVFAALADEWPSRYTRDDMLLVYVALTSLALSWCLTQLTRDGDDGFELIDLKSGQRANAGSTPRSAA